MPRPSTLSHARHERRVAMVPTGSRGAVLVYADSSTVVLKHRVDFEPAGQGLLRPRVPTLPNEPGLYLLTVGLGKGYLGRAADQSLASRLRGPRGSIMENLPGASWVYTVTSTMALPPTRDEVIAAETLALRALGPRWQLANHPATFSTALGAHSEDEMVWPRAALAALRELIALERPLLPAPLPGQRSNGDLHRALAAHLGTPVPRGLITKLVRTITGLDGDISDLDSAVGRDLHERSEGRFVRLESRRGWYAPVQWLQVPKRSRSHSDATMRSA